MGPSFSFERLEAFKAALEVLEAADSFCRYFTGHRRRGAFQLYGAASSVVENLSESSGRRGPRDRAHHVDIANGSAHEVAGIMKGAERLRIGPPEERQALFDRLDHLISLLVGLSRSQRHPR